MDREITVVSGLPRSGTSMMMGMLKAGGMEVLVDDIRKADVDNPKGYFEFEKVKKIKEDASWLSEASDKVFKMVSMLLKDLPPDRRYRIIFMRRAMAEILASQKKMLQRLESSDRGVSDEEMGRLFGKHLKDMEAWLEAQPHMEVLYMNYNDIIEKPLENARTIQRFLSKDLDLDEMATFVDRALYRQRASTKN